MEQMLGAVLLFCPVGTLQETEFVIDSRQADCISNAIQRQIAVQVQLECS
jgi:hypothetical protein